MSSYTSIHNVTGLDLGAVTQLGSGTYVRDLTIKSSNGGFLQVTLFAQSSDGREGEKALRASFGDRHRHNPIPRTQKEANYDPINR
jgi:hypothetical protein